MLANFAALPRVGTLMAFRFLGAQFDFSENSHCAFCVRYDTTRGESLIWIRVNMPHFRRREVNLVAGVTLWRTTSETYNA